MSLPGLIKSKGPSGFGYTATAKDVTEGLQLTGQTFLVTGCATGLGLETAKILSTRGAFIIAANRSQSRCQETIDAIPGKGAIAICDLADINSVSSCITTIKDMDVSLQGIVCNAGVMAYPKLTLIQNTEAQLYINHLSHFKLVNELLNNLTETARVVMVSSMAHKATVKRGIQFDNTDGSKGYEAWSFYGQSKLANLLFARSLPQKLKPSQKAFAVHPGVIATQLTRYMNPLLAGAWSLASPFFMKTIAQGAATQVFAATHPQLNSYNGEYLYDCNVKKSSHYGSDMALAEELWQWSNQKLAQLSGQQ